MAQTFNDFLRAQIATLSSSTAPTSVTVKSDGFLCDNGLKGMTYKNLFFDNALDIGWFLITDLASP